MMVGVGWAILAWRRAWQLNFEAAQHLTVLRRRSLEAKDGEGWRAMFGSPPIPTRKPGVRNDHSPEDHYRRAFSRAEHTLAGGRIFEVRLDQVDFMHMRQLGLDPEDQKHVAVYAREKSRGV